MPTFFDTAFDQSPIEPIDDNSDESTVDKYGSSTLDYILALGDPALSGDLDYDEEKADEPGKWQVIASLLPSAVAALTARTHRDFQNALAMQPQALAYVDTLFQTARREAREKTDRNRADAILARNEAREDVSIAREGALREQDIKREQEQEARSYERFLEQRGWQVQDNAEDELRQIQLFNREAALQKERDAAERSFRLELESMRQDDHVLSTESYLQAIMSMSTDINGRFDPKLAAGASAALQAMGFKKPGGIDDDAWGQIKPKDEVQPRIPDYEKVIETPVNQLAAGLGPNPAEWRRNSIALAQTLRDEGADMNTITRKLNEVWTAKNFTYQDQAALQRDIEEILTRPSVLERVRDRIFGSLPSIPEPPARTPIR